jgi:hypothetical protein
MKTNKKNWCPGWESNPHEEKSPEDFKSSASAIPPPGHWHYKLNESKDLVQHHRFGSGPFKDSTLEKQIPHPAKSAEIPFDFAQGRRDDKCRVYSTARTMAVITSEGMES